jgi:aspartate carbamoyltransferase catalytic subunit
MSITTKYTITTAAAAALAAGIVGLAAPAQAAPSGGNAADTISSLEAQGNRVIVTRQSSTPLDQASVVSVTRGPAIPQSVPFATSQGDNSRSVRSQTVYVTVR